MANLILYSITKVSTTTGVNMKAASAAVTLYTVPTGYSFIPVMIVIRNNSASLAGGTDFDFTGFRQTVDLSGMTAVATDYRVIYATDNTSYTVTTAGTAFQITKSTGCTANCTATIDLWGYLI